MKVSESVKRVSLKYKERTNVEKSNDTSHKITYTIKWIRKFVKNNWSKNTMYTVSRIKLLTALFKQGLYDPRNCPNPRKFPKFLRT